MVCGGIRMSDIPSFPYRELWEERTLCSVANLTRLDAEEFFAIAPRVPVRTEIELFPLDQANAALRNLRSGASQAPLLYSTITRRSPDSQSSVRPRFASELHLYVRNCSSRPTMRARRIGGCSR